MASCKKCLVITSLFMILLAYSLYVPAYDGYSTSSTVKLSIMFSVIKVMESFSAAMIALGSDTIAVTRDSLPFEPLSDYGDFQVQGSTFNGVSVRVYIPASDEKNRRGVVYYHGGGWILGNPDMTDAMVFDMAKGLNNNTVFVSVDYRLAPEHPFPIPLEDCVKATKYFMENAGQYGVDPKRIAVAGDSAGGNLAASVSLKLRDQQYKFRPKMQVLLYPVLQAIDMKLPSYQENAHDPILTLENMGLFISSYVQGHHRNKHMFSSNMHVAPAVKQQMAKTYLNHDNIPAKYKKVKTGPSNLEDGNEEIWKEIKDVVLSPYVSPLLAKNLAGLPMSLVLTCQNDVLRDEGILYYQRLKADGNDATHIHLEHGMHSIFFFGFIIDESGEALDKVIHYMEHNL